MERFGPAPTVAEALIAALPLGAKLPHAGEPVPADLTGFYEGYPTSIDFSGECRMHKQFGEEYLDTPYPVGLAETFGVALPRKRDSHFIYPS